MENTSLNKKTLNDQFFREIKEKIECYFSQSKSKRTGNYKLYIKSVIFLSMLIACYSLIFYFSYSFLFLAIISIFLGISFAGIGFNIMHDSGHGSFSSKKWANNLGAYSLNLMGGNIFLWKNKHNINHHGYTNIQGIDEDIDIEPWIRTHVNQPRYWYHRYQHIYSIMLYGLTHLNWVFFADFKKYFSRKISNTSLKKITLKEHYIFWISKIIHFSLFIVVLIFAIGFWKALFVYAITSIVCGLILGITFQLAHLAENVEFPPPSESLNKIKNDWALNQIATTVNFATKNKFVSWFTGGLNFQVVHHLFPKISHIHFPVINNLIRETCNKFNIKYTEYPNCWRALHSHFSFLKRMGSIE